MKFEPRPYQKMIIDWQLEKKRNGVWCFMGGGKTISTLTTLNTQYKEGTLKHPTLIIAPLRVAQNTWPDEAKKWEHLDNIELQCISGNIKERTKALENKNANVFTINYENIPWLVHSTKWFFDKIVADESTKLKSFRLRQGGMRSGMLAKVAHRGSAYFDELTGTPAPNGLLDLWGQAWFLDKGVRLGSSYSAFTQRWFKQHYSGFGYVPLPNAEREINERLKDLYLPVRAEDFFPVTRPIFARINVTLPKKAMTLYKEMEKKMLIELENETIRASNAADKTCKCLQISNGSLYREDSKEYDELHDVKLQALESIVNELSGEPIIVAYHFIADRERITKAFKQARVMDQNPQTIREWNAGQIRMLLAHPQSAGHGLNLQDGGRIVVFFGHWWNNEEREQIIERVGPVRQEQSGHPRTVFVYDIVAEDTIDELVLERHESKREINEILLGLKKRRESGK